MPALDASSVGVSVVCIPSYLQIAKSNASTNLCNLREDKSYSPLQSAIMDTGKNGGPNHLQAWREFREMTQDELARAAGTTGAVISLLEAGERGLSLKWLRRLAPHLRTSIGALAEHDPNTLDSDALEMVYSAPLQVQRQIVEITRTLTKTAANG